jgi:hypothetical protein
MESLEQVIGLVGKIWGEQAEMESLTVFKKLVGAGLS